MIKITLPGSVPSKKNSRNIFIRGGRPVNTPNKRYKDWHDRCSNEIVCQRVPRNQVKASEINIFFYLPDARARDLTNMAESIMDLIVDRYVLVDDSWQCTGPVKLFPMGIDREQPRVVLEIFELTVDK